MIPMPTLAPRCLRITRESISVPARKVSRMAPNPARKLTQSVIVSPTMFPATAPTMISISATDIAMRIEITEASKARPSHRADAIHTYPIALPLSPSICEPERGKRAWRRANKNPRGGGFCDGTSPHGVTR